MAVRPNSYLFRYLEFYGTKFQHRGHWWIHSQLRKLLHVDYDVNLLVTRAGLQWCLNPSDYTQSEFFWTGESDRWDIYHVMKLVKPGSTIFDIGANFGYYALRICERLGAQCNIHCFEPTFETYERLVRNIQLNEFSEKIRAHRIGVSDQQSVGALAHQTGNSGASRIVAAGKGQQVSLIDLDAFCEQNQISRLDFIKMDVQGFEPRVLKGAAATIRRFQPAMLVELDPYMLQLQSSSPLDVARIVHEFGYRLYVANRRNLLPLLDLPTGAQVLNAFCLPQTSQGRKDSN
jgi:FkbM family methyltransferase